MGGYSKLHHPVLEPLAPLLARPGAGDVLHGARDGEPDSALRRPERQKRGRLHRQRVFPLNRVVAIERIVPGHPVGLFVETGANRSQERRLHKDVQRVLAAVHVPRDFVVRGNRLDHLHVGKRAAGAVRKLKGAVQPGRIVVLVLVSGVGHQQIEDRPPAHVHLEPVAMISARQGVEVIRVLPEGRKHFAESLRGLNGLSSPFRQIGIALGDRQRLKRLEKSVEVRPELTELFGVDPVAFLMQVLIVEIEVVDQPLENGRLNGLLSGERCKREPRVRTTPVFRLPGRREIAQQSLAPLLEMLPHELVVEPR